MYPTVLVHLVHLVGDRRRQWLNSPHGSCEQPAPQRGDLQHPPSPISLLESMWNRAHIAGGHGGSRSVLRLAVEVKVRGGVLEVVLGTLVEPVERVEPACKPRPAARGGGVVASAGCGWHGFAAEGGDPANGRTEGRRALPVVEP